MNEKQRRRRGRNASAPSLVCQPNTGTQLESKLHRQLQLSRVADALAQKAIEIE
jgi:hypothetical protein